MYLPQNGMIHVLQSIYSSPLNPSMNPILDVRQVELYLLAPFLKNTHLDIFVSAWN